MKMINISFFVLTIIFSCNTKTKEQILIDNYIDILTIINQKLKDMQKRRLWLYLSSTKSMMSDCERGLGNDILWRRLGLQFRMLLSESVLMEKDFSIKTIRLWRKTGKLSSEWQEHLALQLLNTSEIKEEDAEELDEIYSNWTATPHDHQFRPNHPKHFEQSETEGIKSETNQENND